MDRWFGLWLSNLSRSNEYTTVTNPARHSSDAGDESDESDEGDEDDEGDQLMS
jgi:hypothetical protein